MFLCDSYGASLNKQEVKDYPIKIIGLRLDEQKRQSLSYLL